MTVEMLSEVVGVLRESTDVLAELVGRIEAAASTQGVRVLPARVGGESVVTLEQSALEAEEVVMMAAAVGAPFLYVRRELMDRADIVNSVTDMDLPEDCPERDILRQVLDRVENWTCSVEIAFAAQGVLHRWVMDAPWCAILDELIEEGSAPTQDLDWGGGLRKVDAEEIAKLAAELAAHQSFRRAKLPERETAARQIAAIVALDDDPNWRWAISSVVRRATDIVSAQVEACVESLRPRKAELVALLAADPEFRAAASAPGKRDCARVWSLRHTDGLRMPSDWIEEISASAAKVAKKYPAQQTML